MYDGFLNGLEKFLNENPELSNTRIATNNFQIPSMINFYLEPKLEATCLSIGYQQTLYSFLYPNITQKNDDFMVLINSAGYLELAYPGKSAADILNSRMVTIK